MGRLFGAKGVAAKAIGLAVSPVVAQVPAQAAGPVIVPTTIYPPGTPRPNYGGKATKRTPEAREKLLQAIKLGATYELAAGYAGMSYTTLREWARDEPELVEEMKTAEGDGAALALARIDKAAKDGVWTAAAWKLERRYPHSYGKLAAGAPAQADEPVAVHTLESRRSRMATLAAQLGVQLPASLGS